MDIIPIINRIKAGDRSAYAAVIRHYQRPLFGFLGRMGLSQAQAEDMAQEAFLRAWQKLGEFDPKRAVFATWLFTLARNLTLNELARASIRQELTLGDDLPDAVDPQPQPLDALLAGERVQRLQAVLRQLPLDDRSILALAYVEELDMAAIGRIEGCSTGAVKTRLYRIREKLRQLLATSLEKQI